MSEAIILINCNSGAENQVVEELESIDEVKDIRKTFGLYDVVVKVEAESEKDLYDMVSSKIKNIEPVRLVLTLETM